MSTSLSQAAPSAALPKLHGGCKVAVVSTLWNAEITDALADGAMSVLKENGVEATLMHVPGAVELTYAAARLQGEYDAVVLLGCVIRGGTPHFDYVCMSVTEGMTALNAEGITPVIFGVLTVDTLQDALDRAGGSLGNKGSEAAEAAIHMIDFSRRHPVQEV